MGSKEEAKEFLQENYSNHNSWGLYPLSEDGVAEIMVNFTNEKTKQQREVIERLVNQLKETSYLIEYEFENVYKESMQLVEQSESLLKEIE